MQLAITTFFFFFFFLCELGIANFLLGKKESEVNIPKSYFEKS